MNEEEQQPEQTEEQAEEQYLDTEDFTDQQERIEDQQEDIEQMDWAEVPQKRKQESLYTLFNRVWKSPDSSKVGNLNNVELGKFPLMTVRDSQYLALLGYTLKHKKFANFFRHAGEITLSTSASKKGWFTELFVSQKKFTSRASSHGAATDSSQAKKKWSLFGGGGNSPSPPPE